MKKLNGLTRTKLFQRTLKTHACGHGPANSIIRAFHRQGVTPCIPPVATDLDVDQDGGHGVCPSPPPAVTGGGHVRTSLRCIPRAGEHRKGTTARRAS